MFRRCRMIRVFCLTEGGSFQRRGSEGGRSSEALNAMGSCLFSHELLYYFRYEFNSRETYYAESTDNTGCILGSLINAAPAKPKLRFSDDYLAALLAARDVLILHL